MSKFVSLTGLERFKDDFKEKLLKAEKIKYKDLKSVTAETLGSTEINFCYDSEDIEGTIGLLYEAPYRIYASWGDFPLSDLSTIDSNNDYGYYKIDIETFKCYTLENGEAAELDMEAVAYGQASDETSGAFINSNLYDLLKNIEGDFETHLQEPEWFEEWAEKFTGKYMFVTTGDDESSQWIRETLKLTEGGVYKFTGTYSFTYTDGETTYTFYGPKCKKVLSATIGTPNFESIKEKIDSKANASNVYSKYASDVKFQKRFLYDTDYVSAGSDTANFTIYYYEGITEDEFDRACLNFYVMDGVFTVKTVTITDYENGMGEKGKLVTVKFNKAFSQGTSTKMEVIW